MTVRQIQLIDAEISRHMALAKTATDDAIRRSHMDVAEALQAVLLAAERRGCRVYGHRDRDGPDRHPRGYGRRRRHGR